MGEVGVWEVYSSVRGVELGEKQTSQGVDVRERLGGLYGQVGRMGDGCGRSTARSEGLNLGKS